MNQFRKTKVNNLLKEFDMQGWFSFIREGDGRAENYTIMSLPNNEDNIWDLLTTARKIRAKRRNHIISSHQPSGSDIRIDGF